MTSNWIENQKYVPFNWWCKGNLEILYAMEKEAGILECCISLFGITPNYDMLNKLYEIWYPPLPTTSGHRFKSDRKLQSKKPVDMRIYRLFHMCLNQNNTTKGVRFASLLFGRKTSGNLPHKRHGRTNVRKYTTSTRKSHCGPFVCLAGGLKYYSYL